MGPRMVTLGPTWVCPEMHGHKCPKLMGFTCAPSAQSFCIGFPLSGPCPLSCHSTLCKALSRRTAPAFRPGMPAHTPSITGKLALEHIELAGNYPYNSLKLGQVGQVSHDAELQLQYNSTILSILGHVALCERQSGCSQRVLRVRVCVLCVSHPGSKGFPRCHLSTVTKAGGRSVFR